MTPGATKTDQNNSKMYYVIKFCFRDRWYILQKSDSSLNWELKS